MAVNVSESVNVGGQGAWSMSAVGPPPGSHSYSLPSPLGPCDTRAFALLFGPAIGAADEPSNEA
eukprot:CAMPEP_0198109838 /NCGR_PEP_ID=MMETSP1442-20131203/1888_1 /TAXON_ID= /ORGANISM="Craspedostauros australis, Strain CCMP3328" /LENGTH=63 /DNA_ID=CAMNT_0043765653 /DNA_START=260 /DNA_END=447 /DNA_ORIENTATION=+